MFVNTVLWIFLVPFFATAFGLVYAVLVDRTRYEAAAKALIFLPTAVSLVAASVIWRYVYYQPAPRDSPDRCVERDRRSLSAARRRTG